MRQEGWAFIPHYNQLLAKLGHPGWEQGGCVGEALVSEMDPVDKIAIFWRSAQLSIINQNSDGSKELSLIPTASTVQSHIKFKKLSSTNLSKVLSMSETPPDPPPLGI